MTRRVPGASSEVGVTLVELLVVMMLFGVISGLVATQMIATQRVARNVGVRASDLANVQVSLESMTKLLRTAAVRPTTGTPDRAFAAAGPSSLSFYGYNVIGRAPSLVSFTVDGTQRLVESVATTTGCTSIQPSDWTYGTPRTRVLARSVNQATTLFTYHGTPTLTSPLGPVLVPTGSPALLSDASLALLDSVEITLSVDLPSSPDIPSASATTQVALPNLLVSPESLPEAAC